MTRVVLLCRVSTERQDYTRQVKELSAWCKTTGWEIDRIFANKVSGAKKNAVNRNHECTENGKENAQKTVTTVHKNQ